MFEANSHAGRSPASSTSASTDPGEIRPAWTFEPDDDPDRAPDSDDSEDDGDREDDPADLLPN